MVSQLNKERLTIAVELIANPSTIFMDEPTSVLDARAAVIVMRTVRNIVDTCRTIVCTIHQPSIDIFEAFDELLLMKRGGQVIYAGSLGHHSRLLIEYFQSIPGVPTVKEGYNPATWMLDITTPAVEGQLNVDFCPLQVAIEIIYIAIQTIIYSLLLYSMIGFHWTAAKFFWFYFFVFMCFVYFIMYGMMFVALTPSYPIVAIVITFVLNFWNLFSGLFIPRLVGIISPTISK